MHTQVAGQLAEGGDVLLAEHSLVHENGASPHAMAFSAAHAEVDHFRLFL